MSRVVCEVCDTHKPERVSRNGNQPSSWCHCCRSTTQSRIVARDRDYITPESAMTYEQQRHLYEWSKA